MRSRRKPRPALTTKISPVTDSLQEEIDMLRALMRMVEKLADEGKSLGEMLKMLDILGKSSTRLASLLRAQKVLCEEREFGSVFNQALSEVIEEMGMDGADSH